MNKLKIKSKRPATNTYLTVFNTFTAGSKYMLAEGQPAVSANLVVGVGQRSQRGPIGAGVACGLVEEKRGTQTN